ncbi:MAG: sulfatase-like hydrolase/transferase [Saprospiraceae bacterium]|nr:sulfatase-like hydrolase/transferase [Saprospiraceae bacterium]
MFRNILLLMAVFLAFATISCKEESMGEIPDKTASPNILLIIADDLGKDAIKGYSEGLIKPNTPNIDLIRTKGLLFNNFWTNPVCTPTRSCILTGKYGYRTGVRGVSDILSQSEISLQQYINSNTNNTYATAIVGKWHLAGTNTAYNPESMGIDYYSGIIRGAVTDYYQWQLSEDGITKTQNTYVTEALTNTSINWINQQTKPWFMWLAYNAPHTPFHVPPSDMHSQGSLPAYTTGMDAIPYYMAAIEAMDFQIGRLLNSISAEERDNTIIIFLGDNGPANQVAQSPYISSRVKSTLYQGGINVPLFISGKGVTRTGEENNLIVATDLFSTIAEVAGVKAIEIHDSKSFVSLFTKNSTIRNYQYTEIKDDTSDIWAISNGNYKLIENVDGVQELYFLSTDPYELQNLLNSTLTTEQSTAKTALETELNKIRK